ncbi:Hpt domain-containing protein [Psychrobacter faecalis]|uniref:Hpt domain-containing protein n=1 Tax=Psychrobacter faecalis TaxID=180588 RepID=A0ABT9HJP1_9GAMM|nr:Hpt domain-containing protein [Psychrobacter faecalis]MDP4545993.1 Hpt domain-containing protein [Psychrobacter faecalis]
MTEHPNNTNTQNDDEIINDEQFDDMRELLEEDFVDLIQVFFTDSHERIVKLRRAQQEKDNANGYELAHALKGASANLGATQLTRLSNQLQEACRERLIGDQAGLVEDVAVALQRVEQEIKQRLGL